MLRTWADYYNLVKTNFELKWADKDLGAVLTAKTELRTAVLLLQV